MKHVHHSADDNNVYKTCAPAAGSPVQANIGRPATKDHQPLCGTLATD